jgi:transcriptional regulator with XRE-family HTH domain
VSLAEQFGRRLFMERRRLGVSQEALASFAGLHRTEVQKLEAGKREPQLRTIVKLAHGLGIDPAELLRGLAHHGRSHIEKVARPRRSN